MEKRSGHTGTPLSRKLGFKPGMRVRLINSPPEYLRFFDHLPAGITFVDRSAKKADLIHFFTTDPEELVSSLPDLRKEVEINGCIWISWPKKASGVKTGVTEDVIRIVALQNGLVDIKVCAVNDTWSALKLVIPVSQRGVPGE